MPTLNFLLVDDDLTDRFIARQTLNQHGELLQITEVSNGSEALNLLSKSDPFHLVILDINMPLLSGKDLLAKCNENKKCCKNHFVMLTSSASIQDKQDCISLGAIHYAVKPLTFDTAQKLISIAKKKTFN